MKQKLIKFGLIFMTVFLLGSTIYITLLLKDTGPTAATTVKKTKAASITYRKTLALNTNSVQPTISERQEGKAEEPEPTAIPTEKLLSYNSINQTGQLTPTSTLSPTISASTLSPTISASTLSPTLSSTTQPTGVTSLPQSGWMQSSIAIFTAASIFIFLSFLY